MSAIFAVTLPFFALVLGGYLAARARLLPEAAIPGLNAYVLFFALPCLLFRFGAGTPLGQLLDPGWLALYATCALLVVAVTVTVSLGAGLRLRDAAFGALVAAFPNTGFMGVPLLVALLGPQAAGPVILTVLVDLFLTSSLCLALAQSEGAGSLKAGLAKAVRGALGNPLPWAIALGALVSVSQAALPGPLAQIVRMLADSATPVALFTIGAVLWRANAGADAARTPWRHVVPVVTIKLLLHPALVLATGHLASAAGLPLRGEALQALVLAAALPSASNVSLLAERYGADNGRIARIVLYSTAAAFLSFSFAVALFQRFG
ncbi:AEC family transporter [Eleftheria terrae]|uniref:AEC family transporter n=1 Tax=Eleftheria terrae TaxID=1597781 RepID=UPI00263B6754|nr:AEC family transporter [Eleftheria terrae]WKB51531.1 AEC family transporter [Eleftheria terrae]